MTRRCSHCLAALVLCYAMAELAVAQRQPATGFDTGRSGRFSPSGSQFDGATSTFGGDSPFDRQGGDPFDSAGRDPFERRSGLDERGFVGRDAEDVRENFRRSRGRQRGTMMFDMMLENLNEMRRSDRRYQAEQQPPPPVRVRFRPIFQYARPAAAEVAATMQDRMTRSLATTGSSASVSLEGGVATLRGSASTERDRKVAERMAALQPGVQRVDNQLRVAE